MNFFNKHGCEGCLALIVPWYVVDHQGQMVGTRGSPLWMENPMQHEQDQCFVLFKKMNIPCIFNRKDINAYLERFAK